MIPDRIFLDSIDVVGEVVSGWMMPVDHVPSVEYIRADLCRESNTGEIPDDIRKILAEVTYDLDEYGLDKSIASLVRLQEWVESQSSDKGENMPKEINAVDGESFYMIMTKNRHLYDYHYRNYSSALGKAQELSRDNQGEKFYVIKAVTWIFTPVEGTHVRDLTDV